MTYDISNFWAPRLAGIERSTKKPILKGWSVEESSNVSFVEAELTLREGWGTLETPIWFVAAPGAVGKSTLAKQISAQTGIMYLDLANADTVAGNYLSGGLLKNGMSSAWQNQTAGVLIDALDEARLRVTQKSFEDFLLDIVSLSTSRRIPTILFGKVGIVDEAWLILSEQSLNGKGLDCPVFDIKFFDSERARLFILATLDRLANRPEHSALKASLEAHRAVYQEITARSVQNLSGASKADGARFSGYAPVLEAVATVLAGVTNPAATLNETAQEAMTDEVLTNLTDRILKREADKLQAQLPGIPIETRTKLYLPAEQLVRLANIIFDGTEQVSSPILPPDQTATYEQAVANFMSMHPFLDGTGRHSSGAVFAALLSSYALLSTTKDLSTAAERFVSGGPNAPNPFLADFYLNLARRAGGDEPLIPPEHVVALYDSVVARSSPGDVARLSIEGDDETDEADVEIQTHDNRLQFRTSQAGQLRFGNQVFGAFVDAPQLDVIIGNGNAVELIAPVSLNIGRLTLHCQELVVSQSEKARSERTSKRENVAVFIEANELVSSSLAGSIQVRKGVELALYWPNVKIYPWTQYAADLKAGNDEDIEEALRCLRRLILAFRSHSKGQLARYEDKIEHIRMTKGAVGVKLRKALLRDRVLSHEGSMYYLHPATLGQVVGGTYQDLNVKRFNDAVRRYVANVVSEQTGDF